MRTPETTAFWVGRLPHWEVVEGRYFVTIHVAGAIPLAGRHRIRAISARLRGTEANNSTQRLRLQRRIFAEMENWLDRTQRVTHLQRPEIAELIVEAIDHRTRAGIWRMFEFVVMPSHVHLFFELHRDCLKAAIENFKQWTGRRANERLRLDAHRFWQREWFDHWSRSDEEDERIVAYIRRNVEKAGLVSKYTEWPYGSWSR